MALILRGLRSVPLIRPSCLGATRWHTPDGKLYSSDGPKVPDNELHETSQKDKPKTKQEEARLKLNQLLESIEKQRSVPEPTGGVTERLARPGARPRPRDVVPNKRRATPSASVADTPPRPPKAAASRPAKQPTLDEQVAAAAREVASSLSGDPAETERDLLSKLTGEQEQPAGSHEQLSELMSGMKVEERRPSSSDARSDGRAQHVRRQVGGQRADAVRQARRDRPPAAPRPAAATGAPVDAVDLRKGDRLGIFDALPPANAATEVAPPAGQWEKVHARELRLSVAHPPANAWEEMAVWTEQGKLWHLPVDNEQGLEEEASVGFHEHVFLESRLEPWCPLRGPIRQFMELVCVALGKNPWLSVQEKHEHIEWFREYFAGKQKLLQELKAV